MSVNWETVKTNIYNWVIANIPAGMPATMYYENSPRPSAPYVTINLASIVQVGWDYHPAPSDNAGDVTLVGNREFTVQLQAYGGDPFTVMENLRTSLQLQSVLDSLRANGIVFANWFPLNDITLLVDTTFEKRTSMDVLFRIAQTTNDTVGTIGTVELQEVLENASGSTIYDQTFLIPPN